MLASFELFTKEPKNQEDLKMLRIKNLKIPELAPFDFELQDKGSYGIIGRNGIGKSTFFSVLSGEIPSRQAELEVGQVVYIPDIESFDDNLTALDYFSILNSQEAQRAREFSDLFGLTSYQKKRIGKYSLGMKQLLATILSFSLDSEVLIIDELFSGLDVAVKAKVYQVLKTISKEKIVLLTSHQLKEIEHFCDKTFLLSETGLEEVHDFDAAAKVIGFIDFSGKDYFESLG